MQQEFGLNISGVMCDSTYFAPFGFALDLP